MFVPSAADPPITSITDDQRQALRSYFGNCVENGRSHRSHPLDFTLMLIGDKPACTMHPSEEEFPADPYHPASGLQRLCDRLDLAVQKPREVNWWFVAPTYGRLDLLPSGNRCDRNEAWHKRLGVVLGYPPSAVEAFTEAFNAQEPPKDSEELVAEGHFTAEEIANAGFVSYRHEDSIERYEQAIEEGKRIRDRLEQLANEWNVPELSECVSDRWERAREKAQVTAVA